MDTGHELKSEIHPAARKIHQFIDSGAKPLSKYPGVTRILSATKTEDSAAALQAWRDRVGDAEADRILHESQKIGHSLDMLVQRHFLDEEFDQELYKDEPGFDLYRQLKAPLRKVDPMALQLKVWSDSLRVCGYLDLVGLYDGDMALMDIKNTRRPKKREYVEDYFLQCTLYAMMLYELTGVVIKKIGILMADRSGTVPQIFIEPIQKYIPMALSRVRQYHEVN